MVIDQLGAKRGRYDTVPTRWQDTFVCRHIHPLENDARSHGCRENGRRRFNTGMEPDAGKRDGFTESALQNRTQLLLNVGENVNCSGFIYNSIFATP